MSGNLTMKQNTAIDAAAVLSVGGFSLAQIDAALTTIGLAAAVVLAFVRIAIGIREWYRGRRK